MLDDKRVAELFAQRDAPQTDGGVRTPTRGGRRQLGAFAPARRVQTRNEVARQERTIAGRADDPFDIRPVRAGPVEPRQLG